MKLTPPARMNRIFSVARHLRYVMGGLRIEMDSPSEDLPDAGLPSLRMLGVYDEDGNPLFVPHPDADPEDLVRVAAEFEIFRASHAALLRLAEELRASREEEAKHNVKIEAQNHLLQTLFREFTKAIGA